MAYRETFRILARACVEVYLSCYKLLWWSEDWNTKHWRSEERERIINSLSQQSRTRPEISRLHRKQSSRGRPRYWPCSIARFDWRELVSSKFITVNGSNPNAFQQPQPFLWLCHAPAADSFQLDTSTSAVSVSENCAQSFYFYFLF